MFLSASSPYFHLITLLFLRFCLSHLSIFFFLFPPSPHDSSLLNCPVSFFFISSLVSFASSPLLNPPLSHFYHNFFHSSLVSSFSPLLNRPLSHFYHNFFHSSLVSFASFPLLNRPPFLILSQCLPFLPRLLLLLSLPHSPSLHAFILISSSSPSSQDMSPCHITTLDRLLKVDGKSEMRALSNSSSCICCGVSSCLFRCFVITSFVCVWFCVLCCYWCCLWCCLMREKSMGNGERA